MIKKNSEMKTVTNENMKGGKGQIDIRYILSPEEMKEKAKMAAVVTLEPGCSIGDHGHENEEEIYYVIKGTVSYNDNGEEKILTAGDCCVCFSGENHGVSNNSDETAQLFAFILPY